MRGTQYWWLRELLLQSRERFQISCSSVNTLVSILLGIETKLNPEYLISHQKPTGKENSTCLIYWMPSCVQPISNHWKALKRKPKPPVPLRFQSSVQGVGWHCVFLTKTLLGLLVGWWVCCVLFPSDLYVHHSDLISLWQAHGTNILEYIHSSEPLTLTTR